MIGFSCHGLSTTSEKTLAGYCRFLLLQSKFFPNIADNERRHENEDHHAQFAPARHARESRGLFFSHPRAVTSSLISLNAPSIIGTMTLYPSGLECAYGRRHQIGSRSLRQPGSR
jgi:hypothetical protein